VARKIKGQFSIDHRWTPLVHCIADLFGSSAEVVLHDLRHPEHSVVLIRNGHVTGRKVGAPLTDLGFLMLRDAMKGKDLVGVYTSKTASGKMLKCNAVVLRDDDGEVAAMLCINLDVTPSATERAVRAWPEHYANDVRQVIASILDRVSRQSESSGGELSGEEKLAVIGSLNQQGVFLARGAVKEVSARLGMALPTVYKYIQKLHKAAPKVRT
jgi:predicted transcriptional regulator YheO